MGDDRVDRRLAAIFAADIAGYSRLMASDEEGTLRHSRASGKDWSIRRSTDIGGGLFKPTEVGRWGSSLGFSMLCAALSIFSAVWPSATRMYRRTSASWD